MKFLKAPLALALAAQLLVATAQAEDAVGSAEAAPNATGTKTISMPLQAFTVHFQTGLEYANRKAVEPTTEFLTDGIFWMIDESIETSNALMNGVAQSYNSAVQVVVNLPDLPTRAGRAFFGNMQGHDFPKFVDLVYDTGFALADVEVGVSLLPSFSIYFEHQRDLSVEARQEISEKKDDYMADETNNAGYLEAVVLRSLVQAGKYSGEIDLIGAHISILPLPGLSLTFDPVRVLERDEVRNDEAAKNAARALELEAELAQRLGKIEAQISNLLENDQPTSETQGTVTE
ncbi:MAG: hypothetical protein ACO20O_07175 [Pseudomonadales bacterium]